MNIHTGIPATPGMPAGPRSPWRKDKSVLKWLHSKQKFVCRFPL